MAKKKKLQKKHRSAVPGSQVDRVSLQLEYLFEYGVNFRGRIITLTEEIDTRMFEILDAALTELEAQSNRPIIIRIHSPGGYVYDALAIVGRLKASPCKIITEGFGQIMSAATLILASGDKRRVSQFSWFMWHEMSYNAKGRHSDIKDAVVQAEREGFVWCYWMSRFSKQDMKFWKKLGTRKDSYITPKELKGLGVVDEVF